MKKTLTLFIIALLLVSTFFSGCSNNPEIDVANIYVQGILDTIYLGQQSNDFLVITKISTLAQLGEEYENGMKTEADYFSYYFNLEAASEDFEEELMDMYKDIYQYAKYQVQTSSQIGDIYYVDVVVSPIDVIDKVVKEDLASYLEGFQFSAENGDFDELTEEEYNDVYVSGIIELVQGRIQNLGYYEDQTITVEVITDNEDGLYYIRGNSLAEIDEAMIKY